MKFRIPDFPLGAAFAGALFIFALLFAIPDVPYFMVWAVIGVGSLAFSLLGGLFRHDDETDRKPQKQAARYGIKNRPSSDVAALIHAIRDEGRATRKEENSEDRRKQLLDIVTIILVSLTLIAVFMQVHEMVKVYDPIKTQADAARSQADASQNSVRAWVAPIKFALDISDATNRRRHRTPELAHEPQSDERRQHEKKEALRHHAAPKPARCNHFRASSPHTT